MSESVARVHTVGLAPAARSALADALGREVVEGLPARPGADDVVVLSATAGASELPYGNAFSACRALKRESAARVFVAVAADDPFGAEIARFCMADDSLTLDSNGLVSNLDRIGARGAKGRSRTPVDAMLARLEAEVVGDEERQRSALQRILEDAAEATFLEQLTDPETGLFDGPYAAFKLDEEFKRAVRFHHPLSLILLDCGVAEWPEDDADRRTLLAEIASTFLNYCRDVDVLARFTSTEFLLLLPGTGPDGAETLARRMLDELARREFVVPVRISPAAGIVTAPHPDLPDRRDMLARAEACLGLARSGEGRGGVCRSGDATSSSASFPE